MADCDELPPGFVRPFGAAACSAKSPAAPHSWPQLVNCVAPAGACDAGGGDEGPAAAPDAPAAPARRGPVGRPRGRGTSQAPAAVPSLRSPRNSARSDKLKDAFLEAFAAFALRRSTGGRGRPPGGAGKARDGAAGPADWTPIWPLWFLVQRWGGWEAVTQRGLWGTLAKKLDPEADARSEYNPVRREYESTLLGFERNVASVAVRPAPVPYTPARRGAGHRGAPATSRHGALREPFAAAGEALGTGMHPEAGALWAEDSDVDDLDLVAELGFVDEDDSADTWGLPDVAELQLLPAAAAATASPLFGGPDAEAVVGFGDDDDDDDVGGGCCAEGGLGEAETEQGEGLPPGPQRGLGLTLLPLADVASPVEAPLAPEAEGAHQVALLTPSPGAEAAPGGGLRGGAAAMAAAAAAAALRAAADAMVRAAAAARERAAEAEAAAAAAGATPRQQQPRPMPLPLPSALMRGTKRAHGMMQSAAAAAAALPSPEAASHFALPPPPPRSILKGNPSAAPVAALALLAAEQRDAAAAMADAAAALAAATGAEAPEAARTAAAAAGQLAADAAARAAAASEMLREARDAAAAAAAPPQAMTAGGGDGAMAGPKRVRFAEAG